MEIKGTPPPPNISSDWGERWSQKTKYEGRTSQVPLIKKSWWRPPWRTLAHETNQCLRGGRRWGQQGETAGSGGSRYPLSSLARRRQGHRKVLRQLLRGQIDRALAAVPFVIPWGSWTDYREEREKAKQNKPSKERGKKNSTAKSLLSPWAARVHTCDVWRPSWLRGEEDQASDRKRGRKRKGEAVVLLGNITRQALEPLRSDVWPARRRRRVVSPGTEGRRTWKRDRPSPTITGETLGS